MGESGGKDPAYRIRWSVPHEDDGGTGSGHQGTGVEASELEHGSKDNDRFGFYDE